MDQFQDELPSYSLAVGITNNIPAETINQNNSNDAANNRSRNRPPLQMQLSVHRLAIHELKPLPALVPKDDQVEPVTTSSAVNIGVSSISSTNISRQSATSARRLRPFRNFKDTMTYLRRVIFSRNTVLTRRENIFDNFKRYSYRGGSCGKYETKIIYIFCESNLKIFKLEKGTSM